MSFSFQRGKRRKALSKNQLRKNRQRQTQQAEFLEARQLLAADVYVDASWVGLMAGVDPDGPMGPATEIGVDAFATIQAGVNAVDPSGTVTVGDGTYNENVTINKNLTLQSVNGRSATTIDGNNAGTELGAVFVTNNTTAVTIEGFTILGLDGTPGLEKSAVYFQGSHSGAKILNNELVARGDSALLTEYGATIDNFLIDGNIFSGQTFTGLTAGGSGFGSQFTTPNVPRQLVAMGGGTGGGNTSNITFTNNQITGTAGGLNDMMQEQGNTLVTIDAKGVTISDNTFAGTTTRYGSSLRARGEDTKIENNVFDLTNQSATTNALFVQGSGGLSTDPDTLGDVVNNNTFSDPVFAIGNTVYPIDSIQGRIDAATAGDVLLFSGDFTENVVVDKAITLGGDFKLNGTLSVTDSGAILSAGFSPGIIASGDLSLIAGSTLAVEFNNIGTPGADFDQYQVVGTVSLGGATLSLTGAATGLTLGDKITIIDNDDTDAVTGTFAGLANGATVMLNGDDYRIFYDGGDGNDVVLVRDTLSSASVLVDDDFAGTASGAEVSPGFFYLINAFSTIQAGVADVNVGGTVTVNDGSYMGNVTISKNLTLQSANGRDFTTIDGNNAGTELGAIFVKNNTTDVTIDGFTVLGLDGTPGLEKAAIYFQGSHSGAKILNNDIVARGDSGLITEYGATIDFFTIDGNIFSGQTFVGPNPAGLGFSTQFTEANVPRQLVVIGGGSGGGNTSDIIFTNNQITGTAGGLNAMMQEQGNTLVTIDSDYAEITGNTFAGTTTRYGSSLRARGVSTQIENNTFDLTNQTPTTNALFLWNGSALSTDPDTFEDIFNNNNFGDNAYFVNGSIGVNSMQQAIDNASPGDVLYFIGNYTDAAVDINKAVTVAGEFNLTGTLTASASGAVISAGFSPGIIASGDLSLTTATTLAVEFNALGTAGVDYDQYQVTGTVDLGGATFSLTGTAAGLSLFDEITIIDNDGVDAVTGTFAGLANGAVVSLNSEDYRIFYNGGDGNDVTLVRDTLASMDVLVDDDFAGMAANTEVSPGFFYLVNAFSTIQEGVNDVTVGGTVTVNAGTYVENVTLNKELTLISSADRDNTTIEGISGVGALATVLITSDNVQLGESGKGFTIIGIDNGNPAIENAAIYIDNNNDGTTIEGNRILANGDSAILTEYNQMVTNLTINDNIIGGTTFVVPPMGGPQFSTNNVPRGLVYINGGSTNDNTGMTANITFTNNTIEGVSGGVDAMMMEVGASLVTIDSDGATITGNEFKGTTTGTASTLQARGKNAVITGNTFDTALQGDFTNIVSLLNTSTGQLSIAPDTLFDFIDDNTLVDGMTTPKAYFEFIPGMTPSQDRLVVRTLEQNDGTLQGAVNAATDGSTLYFLDLYGTYVENLDVNKPVTVGGEFTLDGELKASVTDANINAGFSPGTIYSTDLTLTAGSKLTVEVNDVNVAGTDYDQYVVTGTVDLGGATLDIVDLPPPSTSMLGHQLVLIDNDGMDAVIGTFAGLVNGDVITIDGENYKLFYDGGDGNDVVLIRDADVTPTVYVDDDWAMGVLPGQEVLPGFFFEINAFATIQEGVDDVDTDGDVLVREGSYDAGAIVLRGMTIHGEGMNPSDVMVTETVTHGFFIDTAGDVILQNMQIQSTVGNGVFVPTAGSLLLEDLILNNNGEAGFVINTTPSVVMTDVEYQGNAQNSQLMMVGSFTYNTTTGEADVVDINSPSIGGAGNFQHNRGGAYQDIVQFTDVAQMFVNTFEGLDRFTIAPHLTTVINIDGGAPIFGDPDVPPGDVLALYLDGVVNPVVGSTPNGSVTSSSHAAINYVSIETIIVPDALETNDSIAQATILGSPESVIINNLSIHDDSDVDFFRYTAHFTGKLYINALFTNVPQGDLQLDVFDQSGDLIASVNTNDDNEQLIIPVVSQQKYFIRVKGTTDDVNQYSLEVENFEAPAPHGILISPLSDTGTSSLDNVTNSPTPLIYVQDDLLQFVDENGNDISEPANGELRILTAAEAVLGMTDGYAVQVTITNLTTGVAIRRFANPVGPADQATVFVYDPTVYGDSLADGNYLFSARTVVFDGQTPITQGNANLATSVRLTVDAVTPGGSMPTLVTTSDSGKLADDEVTNISQPIFKGTGEPNTKVFLFANNNTNPIGQGTVDSQGNWSVQVSPLADGVYSIRAAYEDLAGNRSAPSPGLQIEIDTLAPNTPYLDLITASDSGQVNDDNVTNDNTLTFTMTTTDPNSASHIFTTNFQYRIYARPEGGAEFLLYDSSTDGAIPAANVADGMIDLNFLTRETGALADGRYNFKLEVEDRAGNISTDFLLGVTVDTVAPTGDAPDLLASSDSGMLDNDWVTNIDTPSFSGTGEVNSKVFLYADTELVGQTIVNADGTWTIKSTALEDGVYVISTVYEDLAGNRSMPQLADSKLEVDTYVPNTPYLDLAAESDTGRNDEDNVTMDNTLTFNITTTDPNQPLHLFSENYKFRIYLRAENGSETLIYDSAAEFTSMDPLLDGFTDLEYLSRTMDMLADGYHDFKLEVEDRAGNISTDYLLDVVIDTVSPDAPTLEIDPSTTDTGVTGDPNTLADNITSDSNTGFVGDAESNSVIRLYATDTPLDGAALSVLNGMSAADVIAFLNGNYVYQGLTAASPLDGNDGNPEVGFWSLTGKYDLNNPNYFAFDGIRQIVVTSEDLAGNISIVTTLEMMVDTQGPTIDNVSVTGSPDYDLFAPKPSVDGPTPPITSLDIDFSDLPIRPGVQLFATGNSPDVTFVIDASASTLGAIAGTQVGDLNGDGIYNTKLDAEIAAIIKANQQLIDAGLGDVAKVSLVVMVSGTAVSLDLSIGSKFTTAAADNNNDGKLDLINALESINAGGSANYTAGLQAATTILENSGFANSTVLFFADGFSGTPGAHTAAAADLAAVAKNIYAIGVGTSDLAELQIIDPDAAVYETTNALLNTSVVAPTSVDDFGFLYPAISDATALQAGTFQLIGDANGLIPIKSITITHDTTAGSVARSTVTLEFFEALPDDRYTLKIADSLTDPAGNMLDGESNAAEPQDDPSFATGNGVAGGSFLARFTIDSHPEIGVTSYGTTLIDINGNFMVDTENSDDTNEDLTFAIGFSTDDVFAGQFTPSAGSVADGFDRLAVYGKVNGKFRFQFDFDNDGAPDATVIQNIQVNGLPVAGNFDGNADNGDEVGVYVGETGTFWIDTNHDNQIDTPIYTQLVGKPIVGDWDGDGFDDLGVWRDDKFFLDLTGGVENGWDGKADQTFWFGFEGVRERPVSADFNSDGVEDLGLFVPDQQNSSSSQAEWFLLISDSDENGVARPIWENPDRMIPPSEDPLGRNVAKFLTDPFGPDQYAMFGNNNGLPIVGNFDPPVADAPPQNPTPVIEFPEINLPTPSHGSSWEEAADLDHDGAVTLLDLALVIRQIGNLFNLPSDVAWAFDFDHDGVVSLLDLTQIIKKIGTSAPSTSSFTLEAEEVAESTAPAPAASTSYFEVVSPVASDDSESMISGGVAIEGESVSAAPVFWIPSDVTSTTTMSVESTTYQAVDAEVVAQQSLDGELVDEQLLDSLTGDSENFETVDALFTEEEDELDELFVF
ncbi:Ig-like domain-containing protein [Blastopirellula sp. JC732]|uniref:Probable pectate lyase C n=1 Tax=Blastopirellula sediminis TaxID=2894196 RepID=A0A9X1MK74_9BACT|nr:Ig-like domain-containing protein [Blastopirellula sediminis]MCC9609172.1 Ig-like domain-containing protein [Blastopirellula sediminis]MCC9628051.1 Ig-like domain-containing protein [Blastopirellula sediminis]